MACSTSARVSQIAALAAILGSLTACSSGPDEPAPPAGGGEGGAAPAPAHGDPFDVPIAGMPEDLERAFFAGDNLFDLLLRPSDGLGPLYTRSACGACHKSGVRGPGSVEKMAVVLADGVTTAPDQSKLPWGNTVHPLLTAGAATPILPPDDPSVRLSVRVGPPVLGRGYMEAVDDREILRVEAEQAARADGIHGRANHVVYASEPNPDRTFNAHDKGDVVIGRFGLKARIATLDEFTADALQGDMGITSPLRPAEIPNPDGLLDDLKPGVDVTADSVNARALYMRVTAIPRRDDASDRGRAIFGDAKCSACHVPSLRTREDYPIALLAGVDAPIYSDLLLHDMGDDLADGVIDGQAGSRDWRTAPLIGLRFNSSFLHDSRARTVDEAILHHDGPGSEAASSVALYKALSPEDRAALLAFVEAL